MNSAFYLAWRYIVFHKAKSTLMLLAITVTILSPIALSVLVDRYDNWLRSRAESTPMVVGTNGNRFDLIMRALYFRPGHVGPVPYGLVDIISQTNLAKALPVHARYTAQVFPVVGTTIDYLDFRKVQMAQGRYFTILGEAIIGSEIAESLHLRSGSSIFTDQDNVYNLAKSFPLKLSVMGVIAPTGTADDRAVFVDIHTAWVIEGLGHGHQDLANAGNSRNFILGRQGNAVTANAALPTYVEITKDNIDNFHFHGDINKFPVSAIIALPENQRAATILMSRINIAGEYQALIPADVIEEMMAMVFRIKRFFNANFVLISLSVLLLLILIVLLSFRLRQGEFNIIHKIGGAREVVAMLQALELAIICTGAFFLSGLFTVLLLQLLPDIIALLW